METIFVRKYSALFVVKVSDEDKPDCAAKLLDSNISGLIVIDAEPTSERIRRTYNFDGLKEKFLAINGYCDSKDDVLTHLLVQGRNVFIFTNSIEPLNLNQYFSRIAISFDWGRDDTADFVQEG